MFSLNQIIALCFISAFLFAVAIAATWSTRGYRKELNASLATLLENPQIRPKPQWSGWGDIITGDYHGYLIFIEWSVLKSTWLEIKFPKPEIGKFDIDPHNISQLQAGLKNSLLSQDAALWSTFSQLQYVYRVYSKDNFFIVALGYVNKPKIDECTDHAKTTLQLVLKILETSD